MDLKEAILSTLGELENYTKDENSSVSHPSPKPTQPSAEPEPVKPQELSKEPLLPSLEQETPQPTPPSPVQSHLTGASLPPPIIEVTDHHDSHRHDEELRFLTAMRERILVLFEGMQSPNNRNIEAKLDLVLNFLEYLLATIDDKIEQFPKK